jgi:hypothetical protein
MRQVDSAWSKVIRQAATDPAFRQALKANPSKVLAEAGVKVDKSTEYVVLEQSSHKFHIVLPPLVEKGELSDEMLDRVAGGLISIMGDREEPPGPGGG